MDGTSSTTCVISQRGTANHNLPFFRSWDNSDHIWLEELIGPLSNQSSPSQQSSPSAASSLGGSQSGSEGTGSVCSWSSGVTCVLHSSIKKHSQEAFQARCREERRWKKLAVCAPSRPHGRTHPQAEQGGGKYYNKLYVWPERGGLCQGRGSAHTHNSCKKLQWMLEEKSEAKVKFSQFLDEVTSNVFDPNSLQAFGRPVSPSGSASTNPDQPEDQVQVVSPRLPHSMAQQHPGTLFDPKAPDPSDVAQKTYLETNIDTVRNNDEPQGPEINARHETPPQLEIDDENVIPPPPEFCQGFEMKPRFPEFCGDFPRYPNRSVSLPRGINMVSDKNHPSL